MYGIFMESVVIFKLYGGNGVLTILYLFSLVFLLIRERDRTVRRFFVWLPLLYLFLFFCPLFRKLYVRVMHAGDTQYRMLWLCPMGMTVACAGCRLASWLPMRGAHLTVKRFFDRLLLPALTAVLIILCGSLVYRNPYVTRAENAWHLPQEAVEVCDAIRHDYGGGYRVRVAVPEDLVHFIRQYDTDLILAYGRDIVAYGYYNRVREALDAPGIIDMTELSEALRETEADYLVMKREKETDHAPEEENWFLCAQTDEYLIYRDVKRSVD